MKKYYIIVGLLVIVLVMVIIFYPSYPLKYKEYIIKYSEEYNIDKVLVASVIYAESKFDANAQSNKGAVGLMQIMPTTAQEIASNLKEDYNKDKLFEPETNIKYGCYYLSKLINRFKNTDTALCSYNAGMGVVNKWLQDERYSTDGKSLQIIPYEETKNYVDKIKKSYKYYKNKF